MPDEKTTQDLAYKQFPIAWPDVGLASFANNVTVQFDGSVVYISFFQVIPPMIIGTAEEEKRQLEQISAVKALPVAKLALALDVYRKTIEVFQVNLNNIEKIISNDTLPPTT